MRVPDKLRELNEAAQEAWELKEREWSPENQVGWEVTHREFLEACGEWVEGLIDAEPGEQSNMQPMRRRG